MEYAVAIPGNSVLNSKVLILNRSYQPIHVTSVRRAFSLLYQGIARAVNNQYQTFDFDSWSQLSVSVREESVGLVNRVVPPEQLIAETTALATRLAHAPTKAIGLIKRTLNKSLTSDLDAILDYEACIQQIASETEDHQEGVKAFLEKRQAIFRGR